MSDEEYVTALMLRTAASPRGSPFGATKRAIERWSKVLEALILGRRIWYSSECGAVENLLDPPSVEEFGDYLLLVHCLQALLKQPGRWTFGDLSSRLAQLGYERGRVNMAVRHLVTRHSILEEGKPDDDPFVRRTFPLVTLGGSEHSAPYRDSTVLLITPWGEYHVKTMIEQTQYWKHIFYQIVLPSSLARSMDPTAVHGTKTELYGQLDKVFTYLIPVEDSWLYGISSEQLADIGVCPIMNTVREKVLSPLR